MKREFQLASLFMLVVLLTSCGQPEEDITFETWYQEVISEPYDPANGSKY